METFSKGNLKFIILLIICFKSCLLQSTNHTAVSSNNNCEVKIGCNSVMVIRPKCGKGYAMLGHKKHLIILKAYGCLGKKHRKDVSVLWSRVVGNTSEYITRCRQRFACNVVLLPTKSKQYVFLIQLSYGTRQHKLLTVRLKKPELKRKHVKRNIPRNESDNLFEHLDNNSIHSTPDTASVLVSSTQSSQLKSNTHTSDSEAVSHKYKTLLDLLSDISHKQPGDEQMKHADGIGKDSAEDLVIFNKLHHKPVHSLKFKTEKMENPNEPEGKEKEINIKFGNDSGLPHIFGTLHTSKHIKLINVRPKENENLDSLLDHLNIVHKEDVSKTSPGKIAKQKHFPVLSNGGTLGGDSKGKSELEHYLGVIKKAHISQSSSSINIAPDGNPDAKSNTAATHKQSEKPYSTTDLDDTMMTNSLILKAEDQVNAQMLKLESEIMKTDNHLDSLKLTEVRYLQGIKTSINELVRMVSSAKAENKLKATELINETIEATARSIQKLCLRQAQTSSGGPEWAAWNAWEDCSQSCGTGGYTSRRRMCLSDGKGRCVGNNIDIKPCLQSVCPATWLRWGHWSHCSATCGSGLAVRTRPCRTTEVHVHCMGSTAEVMDCIYERCPTAVTAEAGRKQHRSNGRGETNLSVTNPLNITGVWGAWSAWSVCQVCGKNKRHRRRMCINGKGQSIPEGGPCLGNNIESSDCAVSLCPFAKRYPNASRVSEGGSVKLKCPYSGSVVPRQVYWITPRDQHIQHHTNNHRLHILGTSLMVEAARFVDQGKYRCVLLMPKNDHKIIEAPLIVETCRDKSCLNDGKCRIYIDPEFVKFKHYKCKCTGSHIGTFCENGAFLKPTQTYLIIVVIIVTIVICLGLIIFFIKRSRAQKREHEGIYVEKKPPKSDVGKTNVVGKDDSFVEISEYDYIDFDRSNKTEGEKKQPNRYNTVGSDGFDGSFLKYPSPRPTSAHDDADPDHRYVSMDQGKGQYQEPLYENIYSEQGHANADDRVDAQAQQLAQQCLDELDEAKLSWTSLDEPNSNSVYRKKKVRIAIPSVRPGTSQGSDQQRITKVTPQNAKLGKQREYNFPRSITIRDKDQESNFGKHFNKGYISEVDIPTTTASKTDNPLPSRGIIYPSDIVGMDDSDSSKLTLGRVKKNLTSKLGNIPFFNSNQNNGRETSILTTDSVHKTPPKRNRGEDMAPLDASTPLKSMPDIDDPDCFSKMRLSVSVRYKDTSLNNTALDTDEASEQSLCLSDHRYTPGTPEHEEEDASGSEHNMILGYDVKTD